jgi:hypothetical protein
MLHHPGTSFPTAWLARSGLEKMSSKGSSTGKKLVPLSLIENIAPELKTFPDRFFLRVTKDRFPINQNNAGLNFLIAAVGGNDVQTYLPFPRLVALFLTRGSDDTSFVKHLFHVFTLTFPMN